jgi:peptidyl-tRNA hydrolase
MYIVFRADLPEMTRAKGEVQAAHAAASLIYSVLRIDPDLVATYMGEFDSIVSEGQAKICMEVNDGADLIVTADRAFRRGVPFVRIQDAAHTVFDKPTFTCVAFGPCTKTEGNSIARKARMRS